MGCSPVKLTFKNPFKRLNDLKSVISFSSKRSFIKADKQLYVVLGVAFAVSAAALICYWLFKERPYYEKLLSEKDELIKTLKFTRDKQRKIHENAVSAYEEQIKNDYVPKSLYDGKINDYEQKLNSYKSTYLSKEEHEKLLAEREQHVREELQSKEVAVKEEYDQKAAALEQKITALEQKISILGDKNSDLKDTLQEYAEFVKGEKETWEDLLPVERKKAFIPSLILSETRNNAVSADVLKKLVLMKDRLKSIGEMNIPLKPDTYFEMGLVSYYNKQYDGAIEQWENAVSLNKSNMKAYLCLGIAYHEQKMTDNAVKVLRRALEINPKYAVLHLALARIYEQKDTVDDAIYEYSQAVEINPDAIDIHNSLGVLYEKKGLKEEAKKSFALYEKLKKEPGNK